MENNNWSYTAWKKPTVKEEFIIYHCWQKEYCPSTGLEHYQGYIEFKKDYKVFQVKSLFKDKTIHIERARENREVNKQYCFKNGFATERYEFGDLNVHQEEDILDIFNLEH